MQQALSPLRAAALLACVAAAAAAASSAVSDFTKYVNTDITPCVLPCVRVGNCGDYAPNPNGPCNISMLADMCTATYGCQAFNSNGWLKGCGNATCGAIFEGVPGTDSYVNTSSGGNAVPPLPCSVQPVEDVFYPDEEPREAAGSAAPALLAAGPATRGGGWALFREPGGSATVNASVGAQSVFGFEFVALLAAGGGTAVLERTFQRWGFIAYVSASGELARLRKGVGRADNLVVPHYGYLADEACGYYAQVYNNATDYIGQLILAETAGEPDYISAIKYLPPQRDYASIGGTEPYHKFSVSPDGRLKIADSDIWTTTEARNATGPGVLVFDPALYLDALGASWPVTNWTFTKSALVGRHLRVVIVAGFSFDSFVGFEQVAFAPASEPAASAYIRLRGVSDGQPSGFAYYNASSFAPVAELDPEAFYSALWLEQQLWNETLAPSAQYTLPGREGARQVDMAAGALVASMSLYVGLEPNYGDGADYWSPQVDRGGSLPFQEIAVIQNLLDINLPNSAAKYLGFWMDNYITADGNISTGDWEDSCPDRFADGLADYGQMQDMWARIARMQLAANTVNGTQWVRDHLVQAFALLNHSYALRMAAVARGETPGVNSTAGMIYGSPEHDLCHSPDYWYHNNAWFIRGLLESGKFLRDVCATPILPCPDGYLAFGSTLLDEAVRFRADFEASLKLTVTFDAGSGRPVFIPPLAHVGIKPYASMIQDTYSEYSNFRFFSELLGADILSAEMSGALQDFRESTTGTVSGITRWSDHLDDMPSSYYLATSLRDDRIPRFLLLQYGHMANYMGRGTNTATEQLPILADANGLWRDYLWGYLEGGIDMCIPSVMLPAIATRWQFVLERYDEDVLYLARGAPRRWADPAGGGYAVERAATRFGLVSLAVEHSAAAGGGEDARAAVSFELWPGPTPGVGLPTLALRLRASDAALALDAASVAVAGAGALVGVNASTSTITVSLAASGPYALTVTASFR
jgi:hypothetical protein